MKKLRKLYKKPNIRIKKITFQLLYSNFENLLAANCGAECGGAVCPEGIPCFGICYCSGSDCLC